MRVFDAPVEVRTNRQGRLLAFAWRGRRYLIKERVDLWREIGAWWDGEPEKTFLLVRTVPEGLFELYLAAGAADPPGGSGPGPPTAALWRLYKVYD